MLYPVDVERLADRSKFTCSMRVAGNENRMASRNSSS